MMTLFFMQIKFCFNVFHVEERLLADWLVVKIKKNITRSWLLL